LTNLNATVLADAVANRNDSWSSRTRLGTESVILPGFGGEFEVFYVAVKSEDQQAADFGIFAVATDLPLGDEDEDGNIPLFFFPIGPVPIPDGSAERPGGVNLMAFVANPETVRRIVLTNLVTHENAGDLIGYLTHDTDFAVLHNHRTFVGTSELAAYDDSGEEDIPGTRRTDGPGSLNDFQGKQAQGMWTYVMADNAPFQTGSVIRVVGLIEPQSDLTNSTGLAVTDLQRGKWRYFAIDVPVGVTNLIASVYNITPQPSSVDLYLRRGGRPNAGEYDKYVQVGSGGGSLSCSIYDDPPLVSGRYIIGVSNSSSATVSFRIRVDYQYSLAPIDTDVYTRNPSMALLDDAITNDVMSVTNAGNIADVKVGVRIDHPRLSDLVLHLVSPQGTRVLLAENRGGLYAPVPNAVTNLGLGSPTNYVVPFASSGNDAEFSTNLTINADGNAILQIDYQFFTVADSITVYCGVRPAGFVLFKSGYISGSGTFNVPLEGCSDIQLVVNEGVNPAAGTRWNLAVHVTGPWNYATFTDNPNLGGMYKFENPPFFGPHTNYFVLSNSFEGAGATTGFTNIANYEFPPPLPNLDLFEDWRVFSNSVAVITETNFVNTRFSAGTGLISVTNPLAFHGTNYLALSHGQVSLPLTNLVADREYILSFAHRKISSAATQQVAIGGCGGLINQVPPSADILYHIRPNLSDFPSATPPVPVSKLRVCPGQDVRITAGGAIGTGQGPEGDTNPVQTNSIGPLYSLIGCWSSHPCRLDPQTIASSPFYIGASNIVHAPTAPGDYYLFLGVNSEDFESTGGGFDVTNEWQQCQYADAQYALGSTARPVVGQFYWQREKLRFIANSSVTNLVLRTNINTTMIFDDFRIEQPVSTIFYQSEEPMTPLHGELAFGDWRLEIWDNRAGPVVASSSTNATGTLYSWALTFIYGEAVPPIPLTNGVDFIGRVRGEETKYFRVAVPLEVQGANNWLASLTAGSGLELLYSPFGLPRGDGTDPVAIPEGATPLALDALTPQGAALPFGRNYFLAVRNFDVSETNSFTIRAEFDIPVTPLVNGIDSRALPIARNTNSLAAQKDNSLLSVPFMQYWYFDVTTNAHSAKFEVVTNHAPLNPDLFRNLNIVVKRALPVVDLFPTPFNYDYQATEANPSIHDLIFVNSNSMPVKLGAGRWYLGVYNFETNRILYRVRATESDQALFTYTNLTDGVSMPFTLEDRGQLTNFFRFVVDQTNAAVLFEICEMDGDVDLLVRRSDLPSPDLYDFSFLVRNTPPNLGGEPVAIRTNLFIPHLNATNWWLGLIMREDGPLSGTVRATTFTNLNPLVGCVFGATATIPPLPPSGVPALSLTWNAVPGTRYQPEVSVNLNTWTSLGPVVTPRTSFGTVTDTNLNSGSLRFYRIRAVP
jgi:subtilisin-like proprotein convertase family protein